MQFYALYSQGQISEFKFYQSHPNFKEFYFVRVMVRYIGISSECQKCHVWKSDEYHVCIKWIPVPEDFKFLQVDGVPLRTLGQPDSRQIPK